MRIACFLISLFIGAPSVFASETIYTTEQDRELFAKYIRYIQTEKRNPQEVILATADFFLNTPYVAATLEKDPEGLVVNLRELDCTTFVETVFALSKTVLDGDETFDAFCRNLRLFRYRDGVIDGYISRLHYTSDWIFNNEKNGLVDDVSQKIGGERLPLALSFMSKHADKYPLLKGKTDLIAQIADMEQTINARTYYYIPKDRLEDCSQGIQNGDMIGFVTSIEGLDISHVAIAKWVSGKLTFVHASSSHKKVIVEPRTMNEYLQAITKNTGVVVIRPKFY